MIFTIDLCVVDACESDIFVGLKSQRMKKAGQDDHMNGRTRRSIGLGCQSSFRMVDESVNTGSDKGKSKTSL